MSSTESSSRSSSVMTPPTSNPSSSASAAEEDTKPDLKDVKAEVKEEEERGSPMDRTSVKRSRSEDLKEVPSEAPDEKKPLIRMSVPFLDIKLRPPRRSQAPSPGPRDKKPSFRPPLSNLFNFFNDPSCQPPTTLPSLIHKSRYFRRAAMPGAPQDAFSRPLTKQRQYDTYRATFSLRKNIVPNWTPGASMLHLSDGKRPKEVKEASDCGIYVGHDARWLYMGYYRNAGFRKANDGEFEKADRASQEAAIDGFMGYTWDHKDRENGKVWGVTDWPDSSKSRLEKRTWLREALLENRLDVTYWLFVCTDSEVDRLEIGECEQNERVLEETEAVKRREKSGIVPNREVGKTSTALRDKRAAGRRRM